MSPPPPPPQMLIFFRKIEIDVHSFVMFISDIRGDLFVQLMFRIIRSVLKPCQNENANESLISFGPKYLLKMLRCD